MVNGGLTTPQTNPDIFSCTRINDPLIQFRSATVAVIEPVQLAKSSASSVPEPFLFGGIVDVVLDDAGDPADDLHLRLASRSGWLRHSTRVRFQQTSNDMIDARTFFEHRYRAGLEQYEDCFLLA